jgi:hypothetical protein
MGLSIHAKLTLQGDKIFNGDGIRGVPGMLVAVGASSVTVGRTSCPVGGTVHTGVEDARVNLPQADVKNIKVNAPIKT